MNKLDEMWAALAAHKPAPEYADEWATMLKERTEDAAEAALAAAWATNSAWVAAHSAAWVIRATDAAWVERVAQRAIDAIRRVQS